MDSETIRIAGMIRNNRQNEQDKANIYSEAEAELLKAKERSKGDFIQYFKGAVNLVAEKSAAWKSMQTQFCVESGNEVVICHAIGKTIKIML